MTNVTGPVAQASLPELVEKLQQGEEIIITYNQQPVARLVPFTEVKIQPVFGNCRGMLTIVEEDEEHLADFREYMR